MLTFPPTSNVRPRRTTATRCELVIKGLYAVLHRFPGSDFAWNAVNDVTDVEVLSDATVYISTHKQCENQAYNINNGDLFRWKELWPKIAEHFGLETGPNLHISLVKQMQTPDKEELWKKTVKVAQFCCI